MRTIKETWTLEMMLMKETTERTVRWRQDKMTETREEMRWEAVVEAGADTLH
jgi:hypothetical protein